MPYCREADEVIEKAISGSLSQQACLQEQNRDELGAEVRGTLAEHFSDGTKRQPRPLSQKFLDHPNRAGWLYKFAQKTTANWFRRRIRKANHDKRVAEKLTTGIIPAETSAESEERREQLDPRRFDLHQFAGSRGCGPDVAVDPNPRTIEPASDTELELVAAIREELKGLSDEDREFFEDYLDTRHAQAHTPQERHRFARLRKKIREAITN